MRLFNSLYNIGELFINKRLTKVEMMPELIELLKKHRNGPNLAIK